MQSALEAALIVKENPVSQEAVDEACKALEIGLKGLAPAVVKTELNTLVEKAKESISLNIQKKAGLRLNWH